ncbi:hypothetical protein DXV76_06750 [Rhodobacteraceae bacterium CCMM004]|nr:hypothetical protein DXV76_06750 [Rhodobacteraceae bacterium CCMM004]
MFLVEQTTVPTAALPLAAFRAHLRLGTGFADDDVQDAVLEPCLRAALTWIEGQCAKAVLSRSFLWSLDAWRDLGRQVLPRAPVSAIASVTVVDRDGGEEIVAPTAYRLERDSHRPALVASGLWLPVIPVGGRVEIAFDAGFGASWDQVPSDLAQAVMILAARFYAERGAEAGQVAMPADVIRLLGRYRNLRILGGGAL